MGDIQFAARLSVCSGRISSWNCWTEILHTGGRSVLYTVSGTSGM